MDWGRICVFPRDKARRGRDCGGEMPGDEATVGVADGLREGVAEGGLCAEIHLAEEELAEEVGGDGGCFFTALFVGGDGVVGAPVEEAHGEGAEVVVWGEEGRGLWGEGGGRGGGLGESSCIGFVGDDGFETLEGEGFAAAVGGCSG